MPTVLTALAVMLLMLLSFRPNLVL
jgi:hypothetical protein